MEALPRVLVIGATGELGRLVVKASLACNHPTYAFVRPVSDPSKGPLLHSLQSAGATLLQGTLEDYSSLLEAIKQVDIVISAVNSINHSYELKILSAIQEVGTIKRFVLFNYVVTGSNDEVEMYGILRSTMETKEKVAAAVEGSGVPFTHIITYGFASYYTASLGQLDCRSPPTHQVLIAANGDLKAFMVAEEDIAMYAMKAAVDPRAINKNVHLRLPKNHLSQNDLVSLWESKAGKHLERIYESEEDMKRSFQGNSDVPFTKLLKHFTFARGGHNKPLYKEVDDVEAVDMYPDFEYITVAQYLERFLK